MENMEGGGGDERGAGAAEMSEGTLATEKLKAGLRARERHASRSTASEQEVVEWCTDDFLADIPKTDIHVHLDGSLRLETIVELAKDAKLELPSQDYGELREKVFKKSFASLEEYLECFRYTTGVMQSAENLERVAYEFACDNYAENVFYFEVRFAPQLHCSVGQDDSFGIEEVLLAVDRGLRKARDEYNVKQLEIRRAGPSGDDAGSLKCQPPYYAYGIIVSAMRLFFPTMSRYYDALFALHPHARPDEITSMASVNLIQAAEKARDELGLPIVAIDIAGAERNHKATVHKKAFERAHASSFGKTVHAGEGFGPESIWQAIRDLHAERIGHGFHIFSTDQVVGEKHKHNAELFVDRLVKFVSDRRITMEVCLTSNLNTMPQLRLEDHAFQKMVESMVSVCLNTDNRLVSNTTMSSELAMAVRAFGLSAKQLRDIVFCGIKRSFFPGPYPDRRRYTRAFMDWYDIVAQKHGVPGPKHPDFKVAHKVTYPV